MPPFRASMAPRLLGPLLCVLLCSLPRSGLAATGSWLHFQSDYGGLSGFGTATAIDTRRGEAVMFGMWNYPVCFQLNCTPYTNFDLTAFARFDPDPVVPLPSTLPGSPSARENACAAYDSLADQVWLFGGRFAVDSLCTEYGCPNRPSLDDLWRLDLAAQTWHEVGVTGLRPAARYDAALVVDPIGHRLLLFGGHDSTGTAYGDLWSIPLAGPYVWSEIHPAGVGPSARWSASALWDQARQRLLFVGGADASGSVTDVWSLNLVGPLAWSAVPLAGTAPTEVIHAALDVTRDLVVALGLPATVTTFDLSSSPTWTPLDAPGGPQSLRPGGFGYDPVHDVIWLPYAEATSIPGEAEHWLLTLAQPPAIKALDPVLDSVRYWHGFERQWWRLRPQHPGYSSVEVQVRVGGTWSDFSPTQPAPDTSEGGVMTGLYPSRPAGEAYASRMAWTEGGFRVTGGETSLQAPPGPVDMQFSVDTVTVTQAGAVHVVWRALDDSLSLLTPFFVERKDPGGWTPVLNDWPDSAQRIVLNDLVAADTTALDYRIRWDGPLGVTYGGAVHVERIADPPVPEPGTLFLSAPRPNPAGAAAVVDFGLPVPGPATIRLFDLNGRQVREWTVEGPSASPTLDLQGLRPGLYTVRLKQGTYTTSKRLMVFR